MTYRDVKSRKAVLSAITECDRLGRDAFLKKYGFARARSFTLHHEQEEYDSKAILGVAHGYQFPELGPLSSEDFSGGKSAAGQRISQLGFEVDGVTRRPRDWSVAEVEAIVEDYFSMLRLQLSGQSVNKTDRRNALAPSLHDRSVGSIRRKHSNISAVLDHMSLPYIDGYAPLPKKQILLEGVIVDYLDTDADIISIAPRPHRLPDETKAWEVDFFVAPPSVKLQRTVAGARRGVKRDYAKQDARNRRLGKAGEKWVYNGEKIKLLAAGRADLAEQIEWVSDTKGDGLGYDIFSFEEDGCELFIEVKTTNGGIAAPFIVSQNEVAVSQDHADNYVIYRVFNFVQRPQAYKLRGAIDNTCEILPIAYKAAPKG